MQEDSNAQERRPTCIYCLCDSSTSTGLAHVFPEAFGQNDNTLPLGTVCDACNRYLGHELDSTFVSHPVVSLLAQFLQFPGKSGKVRQELGNVRTDVHPRALTMPCAPPKVVTHPDGSRSSTVIPLIAPTFDFRRFRRALHHIGFNALASERGADAALDTRFNPVRDYIRKPKKHEAWPFIQYENLSINLTRDVDILLEDMNGGTFAGTVLCAGYAFGVDLSRTGKLEAWMKRRFPASAEIVGAGYHLPRAQPQRVGPQYRFSIFLDEEE